MFKESHSQNTSNRSTHKSEEQQGHFRNSGFPLFCQPFINPKREKGDQGYRYEIIFCEHKGLIEMFRTVN